MIFRNVAKDTPKVYFIKYNRCKFNDLCSCSHSLHTSKNCDVNNCESLRRLVNIEVLVAEKDSQIEALNREINKMGTELDKMLNYLKTVVDEIVKVTIEKMVVHLNKLQADKEIENMKRFDTLTEHVEMLVELIKKTVSPSRTATSSFETQTPNPRQHRLRNNMN